MNDFTDIVIDAALAFGAVTVITFFFFFMGA